MNDDFKSFTKLKRNVFSLANGLQWSFLADHWVHFYVAWTCLPVGQLLFSLLGHPEGTLLAPEVPLYYLPHHL